MSTSINVQVNGQTVTIQSGEKLEDVKKKLANPADTIFEGVDANSNGKLEAGELQKLKTNLENNNYTVEVAEDGKTPRRAYNDAMQNLRNSYNAETLDGYFKGDDADLHVVKKGETLYTIAKKQLEAEGLPTNDFRAINNRIAQIANLNNINDVNNIKEGVKLKVKLTDEAIKKVKENNNDSAKAFNGTFSGIAAKLNKNFSPITMREFVNCMEDCFENDQVKVLSLMYFLNHICSSEAKSNNDVWVKVFMLNISDIRKGIWDLDIHWSTYLKETCDTLNDYLSEIKDYLTKRKVKINPQILAQYEKVMNYVPEEKKEDEESSTENTSESTEISNEPNKGRGMTNPIVYEIDNNEMVEVEEVGVSPVATGEVVNAEVTE